MARERRKSISDKTPEPELLPFLNIIFMLILALISMSALVPLGFLSSHAQKLAPGVPGAPSPEEEKPQLNLTVFITEMGLSISTFGKVQTSNVADPKNPKKKLPLIPNKVSKSGQPELTPAGHPVYDLEAFHQKLLEIKEKNPDEERMTITADENVRFEVIVEVMDAARRIDAQRFLFPQVSFAAGIVG